MLFSIEIFFSCKFLFYSFKEFILDYNWLFLFSLAYKSEFKVFNYYFNSSSWVFKVVFTYLHCLEFDSNYWFNYFNLKRSSLLSLNFLKVSSKSFIFANYAFSIISSCLIFPRFSLFYFCISSFSYFTSVINFNFSDNYSSRDGIFTFS